MQQCTPLEKKELLNLGETISLYNLSAAKFYRLVKEGQPFMVYYKTRKFIVRKEFEKYLGVPGVLASLKRKLPSNHNYRKKCDKRA